MTDCGRAICAVSHKPRFHRVFHNLCDAGDLEPYDPEAPVTGAAEVTGVGTATCSS